jgi:hypothetical protein
MKINLVLLPLCICMYLTATPQNFSGLQNKKLKKVEDIGSFLESGLGTLLGGKLNGNVDSVSVIEDAEKTLRVKIYYSGYQDNYFGVSVVNESKQKQTEVIPTAFAQPTKASPAECVLSLAGNVAKGTKVESAYLRVNIAKKENGAGNVHVFYLNKKWKNELDPQNVIVAVSLTPIGKASSLSATEAKDVVPDKKIFFDSKILYQPAVPTRMIRRELLIKPSGGGNAFHPKLQYYANLVSDNISGTWINTDAETRGITKLDIVNNNKIHGFGKCHPTDCDWGEVAVSDVGNNNFSAVFTWSFKTTLMNMSYAADVLTVNAIDKYNDGRPQQTNTYTFKKNITAIAAVSRMYTLNEYAVLYKSTATLAGQATSKVPQGPDKNFPIYLFDGLSADVDFKRPQDISNINITVYADKNSNSGIYYILPADYHLKWNPTTEPEKGYDFKILYGTAKAGGTTETSTDAPVRMSATLTAGISSRERNFVKELLKAARPDFVDVRLLPLKEKPAFTFQNTLGAQYNIPESKITVSTSTDLNNDIQVAWQTDADTKEFIQTALTAREGIAASVILKPADEGIVDQQIPAIINLADIRTIGKIVLEPSAWRTRNLRNATAYPLKLKYLHVLKKIKDNTNKPIIYSWSLNDVIVPSQGQAALENVKVPAWLDADPSVVMWVDYSVEDCRPCDEKVMDAVTGGVSGSKSQKIKYAIPPSVFDTLKAAYITITIRSNQVDPTGGDVKELPALKITKDADKDFSAGPLFIPSGGNLDFEYKIVVASTDGEFYTTDKWIKGTDKEILLGKTKMKEIFKGIIPGIK